MRDISFSRPARCVPLEISFSKWADHDMSDWNVIPRCLWCTRMLTGWPSRRTGLRGVEALFEGFISISTVFSGLNRPFQQVAHEEAAERLA